MQKLIKRKELIGKQATEEVLRTMYTSYWPKSPPFENAQNNSQIVRLSCFPSPNVEYRILEKFFIKKK